ncbi:hypothetical protein CR513_05207, partial [Mucuna pruriens]
MCLSITISPWNLKASFLKSKFGLMISTPKNWPRGAASQVALSLRDCLVQISRREDNIKKSERYERRENRHFVSLQDNASPILKMENNQSAAATQDSSIMKSADQRARPKGRNDIMTRRLKNRERQRRYRARKRLEAETNKSFVVEETPAVQVELQPKGNHSNFMTRIYCKRDWKKDARRVHVSKHQEMNESIDPSILTSMPVVTCLAIGNKPETVPEREIQSGSSTIVGDETPRMVLGRRDWKAEARRKKN